MFRATSYLIHAKQGGRVEAWHTCAVNGLQPVLVVKTKAKPFQDLALGLGRGIEIYGCHVGTREVHYYFSLFGVLTNCLLNTRRKLPDICCFDF